MMVRRLAWLVLLPLLPTACSLRQDPPPGASGATIYELQNCANCHGSSRAGRSNGPALAQLELHWNTDSLAEFLRDPRALVEADARLAELRRQYSGAMNSYENLTLAERQVLADWLLADQRGANPGAAR